MQNEERGKRGVRSVEHEECGKRGKWEYGKRKKKKTLVIGSDILYMYFDLFES